MNIIKLIKEEYTKIINENKSQLDFNWREDIPNDIQSKMNIEGDDVVLYHYGTDKNTGYLDPHQAKPNIYTKDFEQWGLKRIFFYVNPLDKERIITGNEYIIKYPLNKLYPFNSDPFNFYEDCKKEFEEEGNIFNVNAQVRCIGNKVKNSGFGGMIFKWGNTLRVDIWEKVKV